MNDISPPRMEWVNYHHLLYFWVVAREGGLVPAGKVLRLSHPTLSAQIHALEHQLGELLPVLRVVLVLLAGLLEERQGFDVCMGYIVGLEISIQSLKDVVGVHFLSKDRLKPYFSQKVFQCQ